RETAQRSARPSPVTPEQPVAPEKPGGRKRTVFIIMGVALLGLVAVGARRWIYSLSHVSTDNAQVDGHIVPILPKVGGYVVDVRTDENRPAKAGDTLVVLDDRDYKARLAQAEADLAVALAGVSNRARVGQAEAQVAQAQANAGKAHADLERIKPLAEKDIVRKQALDAADATSRAADAARATALTSPSMPTLAGISAGTWRASHPRPGRSSRCCRPTTRRGTSPRSCSGSRCGSASTARTTPPIRSGRG